MYHPRIPSDVERKVMDAYEELVANANQDLSKEEAVERTATETGIKKDTVWKVIEPERRQPLYELYRPTADVDTLYRSVPDSVIDTVLESGLVIDETIRGVGGMTSPDDVITWVEHLRDEYPEATWWHFTDLGYDVQPMESYTIIEIDVSDYTVYVNSKDELPDTYNLTDVESVPDSQISIADQQPDES